MQEQCATRSTAGMRATGVAMAVAWFLLTAGAHAQEGGAALREVLVMQAGEASTAILLAGQPTSSAQFAALELQYHLEKITGEKPPIAQEPEAPAAPVVLAVGNTSRGKALGFPVDALEPWEFLVAEKNGTIVLAGGDDPATETPKWDSLHLAFNAKPNGTCRAVFEFLEEYCGVHWYLPSGAGMVVPSAARLVVRMGEPVRRRTDFRSTSFYPYQVNGSMYCAPDTPELTGENVPDSDMEKWRRNLWTIPVTTDQMLPVTEVQRWLLRNKVGGESYGPNHSFTDWLSRFGLEHPEWFSYKSRERIEEILARGKEQAAGEFHVSGEPCFTAPGMFEQEVSDARGYLDRNRGRFFPIVPNDNYVWCQCPTCKPLYDKPVVDCPLWGGATGRASSYMWDFANRVAREIRKTHPDGWVGGIAYHDYMPPPANFELEPNVAVTICTYLGNWTPAQRETAYGLISAWRDQAKCQWIGLWEYFCYCAMAQYQPMFPKVCPKLMGQDVKRLHEMGVVAEFIETEEVYRFKDAPDRGWAVWSNPIWLYLNVWTRFKMWDDTTRDVDRLLDDHYRLFYGPAAEPIQGFFERVEARVTDMSLRGPETFNDLASNKQMADFEYLFPAEVMAELRAYADRATALATDEPYRTRVEWVRDGFLAPQEEALARYLKQREMTAAQRPREGVCYRVEAAPAIDGDAADPAWEELPAHFLNEWRTGVAPKAKTWFRMGYDDEALYLVARCDDPDAADLRAVCQERDSEVYLDDCVELHLTFDADRAQRYQMLVNSLGAVLDLRNTLNEAGVDVSDRGWDCQGVEAAGKRDDGGFTVELKVPLASVGGASDRSVVYANICREKYSGGEGGVPAGLQSWSATQGAFAEGRYFGKLRLVDRDGWSLFFGQETIPPRPVLYKVDAANPWTLTPDAIRAVADQDAARYLMQCPQVDEKGRTYGGFGVKLDPPVDAVAFPSVEMLFTKPSPDVMLELIYNYVDEKGKEGHAYFLPSTYGEGGAAPRVFVGRFTEGMEPSAGTPRFIKSLTVYGVVEGGKTPLETEFSLNWIRVCHDGAGAQ